MPKEQTDLTVRKKMRKGTHSCFECRRRKIRCIFPLDSPEVCSECFARGSRCIDQEHASPDIIVDHRKNLRERVSRLEALVDSLLEDKAERSQQTSQADSSSTKTPNLNQRDAYPPTPLSSENSSAILPTQTPARPASDRGHHVPILSAFEDAINDCTSRLRQEVPAIGHDGQLLPAIKKEERYTITATNADDMSGEPSLAFQAKRERVKQALLSLLPPFEKLQKIFERNGDWWATWRLKCSGTSLHGESLTEFAARALRQGNIGALGTVVLSLGICLAEDDDVEKYIEAVDRYVLSEDEYAATIEGMECLILKSKWFADIGQPRRAWITYRKGLMYAQLMGLHRQRTNSAAHESVWWALYHGDRFLSLLLGLPYGVLDSHCDLTLPNMGDGKYLAPLQFMNKISILAGKVIDRNQTIADQSFAWALQLDQELEDLWKQLDPAWLEYASLLADVEKNAAELRERIMGQMVYHQIRVYLHLPFMLKSQSNPRFEFSRTACLNGSREVLSLYQALRTGEVQPLYECKAIDFVGFTAAVLIMLGMYNLGGSSGAMSAKEQENDMRLIEMSIDIFRRASSEKGGKVASQSAQVLEGMLKKLRGQGGPGACDRHEFVIPYFGTISIKRGRDNQAGMQGPPTSSSARGPLGIKTQNILTPSSGSPSSSSDLFAQQNLSSTTPASSLGYSSSDPFLSYDGFYNWPASHTAEHTAPHLHSGPASHPNAALGGGSNIQVNDDSMNNFPLPTNNFSWQNMPMDIDQDWSWFLNDGLQTSGQPGQTVQGGQLGEMFSQQTFSGFG